MATTPNIPDPVELEKKLKELERLAAKLGKKLNLSALKNDITAIEDLISSYTEELNDKNAGFRDLSTELKRVVDALSKTSTTATGINRSFRSIGNVTDKIKYDAEGISTLGKKELVNLESKVKAEISNLDAQRKVLEIKDKEAGLDTQEATQLAEINRLLDNNGKLKETITEIDSEGNVSEIPNYLKQANDLVSERLKKEKQIQATLGVTGQTVKGITSTLSKFGIDSGYFEDLSDDLREAAKNQGKWGVAATALKGIFKGVGQALKDPVGQLAIATAMMKGLIDLGFKYSGQIADIGKEYAIGAEAAQGFYDYNVQLLGSTKSQVLTYKSIAEAQDALNNELGTSARFNEDLVTGQNDLVKGLGFSNEEAAKFGNIALLNNTTQNDIVKSVTSQNKGILSNKKVLSEVSKVEGQLAAMYKNDPVQIAKAVVQAQKLGMSLEQTKNATEKLLDFESSIQAQMEAEVLTGQTLNLDRARALALQGKTSDAAEEMLKNVGGLDKFNKLNRIQQEAIASAMGMSADELSNTLVKQKILGNLQKDQKKRIEELRAQGKGEQADLLEKKLLQGETFDLANRQISAQEKYNAAVERMKDAFTAIVAGPLGKMVDMLAQGASLIGTMVAKLANFTGIKNLGGILAGTAAIGSGILGAVAVFKTIKGLFKGFPGSSKNNRSFVEIVRGLVPKTSLSTKVRELFSRKKAAPSAKPGEQESPVEDIVEEVVERTTSRKKRSPFGGKNKSRNRGGGMLSREALPGPESAPTQTVSEMFEQRPQAPTAGPKTLASQVEALKRENPGMTTPEALKQIKGTTTPDISRQAAPEAPTAAAPPGPASIAEAVKEQIKEQAAEPAAPEAPSVTPGTAPDLTREVAQAVPGKKRGFFGKMFKGKTAGKIGGKLGKIGRGAGNLLKRGMRSGILQSVGSMALSSYLGSKAESGEEPSAVAQGASTLLDSSGTISDLAQFIPKPGAGATPTIGASAAPVTPTPAIPTVAPATPTPALAPKPVASPVVKSTATQVEALKRANPGMTSKEALARIKSSPTGAVGKELQAASTIGKEAQIASAAGKEVGLLGKVGGFFGKTFGGIGKTLGKGFGVVKNIFKSPIAKGFGKALGPIMAVAGSVMSVMSEINSAKEKQAAGESVNTGNLGKKIVQGAAYPIANFALQAGNLLIPGLGTAASFADGILGSLGYSPVKWVTDNLIDLVPDDAFTGLGDLALGKKSTGAPTAAGAAANTVPSKPKLAVGGVVTKGGVAEVDPGEVYLGKNTRDSFSELVKDTKVQTNLISNSQSIETDLLKQSQSTSQLLEKLVTQSSIVKDLGRETTNTKEIQNNTASSKDITTLLVSNTKDVQSTSQLLEKLSARITNNSIDSTAKTSVEKVSEAVSKTFTASITPAKPVTEGTASPVMPVETLTESTVKELQSSVSKTEKSATAAKESNTTTVVESKQSLDALLKAIKEQTALLAAIRDKRLVVEADKLAYATAKATFTSYGNPLNSTSYTT